MEAGFAVDATVEAFLYASFLRDSRDKFGILLGRVKE